MSLTESHAVRRGSALVNPFWKSHRRRYDWCGDCGAKHPLVDGVRDEGVVEH